MEDRVLQLLADTQSADDSRKNAELQLSALYENEQFPHVLANIGSHSSVPTPLRQSALLVLKQFISVGWSPNLEEFKGRVLISDPGKVQLRQQLLELATKDSKSERLVKASASYAVSKIAAADFPDEWPDLLPTLLHIIQNGTDSQLHGALRVLQDLVEAGFSETQFFAVARDLVGTVYGVATKDTLKPIHRALAVSVFRSCFDILEMVIEEHKAAVKSFMEEVLAAWTPFFLATLKTPLPQAPAENEERTDSEIPEQWRGTVALKLQVVKSLMKIRTLFPTLIVPQSPLYFSTTWEELSTIQQAFNSFYIEDERQGRLEDADNLPYTLDFLVLEELDFMQTLIRAPPVRSELDNQLKDAAQGQGSSWLPEVMKLAVSYAQITTEEEGLWDVDANLFLSEETFVTANYTPRSACGDLVIKLGEWLKMVTLDGLLAYTQVVFEEPSTTWKIKEATLYILCQLLRDFTDTDQKIPAETAQHFDNFVRRALTQEEPLLRARGFLVSGLLTRSTGRGLDENTQAYIEAILEAITTDSSDIVQVACIRTLQDYLQTLSNSSTAPIQAKVIAALAEFVSSHDLADLADSDDVLMALIETLRDVIMIDVPSAVASVALDLLFKVVSHGAENFQLTNMATEIFEDLLEAIGEYGPDLYIRLCEKVLPSLTGAIDVGNLTEENDLMMVAADFIRALAEYAPSPLPQGFVETLMPKLNRILLGSEEANLLQPVTLAVKHLLAHDPSQFFAWRDANGKDAVEASLVIIDRLLGPQVDDHAAQEVGELAAELVEKAGAERLGPFLVQLLQAVALRLASAKGVQLIQSLLLVFIRLSMVSPKEVLDFLSQVDIQGQNGLAATITKWLENCATFAGFEIIRQNSIALSKLYSLHDPRLQAVQVKGELIVDNSGRIKTRSQARNNPDRYTIVPADVKIIKILVDDLGSSSGTRALEAAAAGAIDADDAASDDENDDWEDVPNNTYDLGLGMTKQELMGFAEGGNTGYNARARDEEAYGYLVEFFRATSAEPGFQVLFDGLNEKEKDTLRQCL